MPAGFNIKRNELYSGLISAFVTVIFSMRWKTCLPFSGYMPSLLQNTDQLDVWTRYVIWAREPFQWPISVIHGLNYPFYDASISRGPIPLFAIIFKALSKVSEIFQELYYFPLVEMVFVFLSAYFACKILESYKISHPMLKLAGAVLMGLSFPLLYRSSNYYGVTYFVSYVPLYLGFAYFYKRLYENRDNRSLYIFLLFVIALTMVFEHYVLFGIYFLLLVCVGCCAANYFYSDTRINKGRMAYSAKALLLSMMATLSVVYILGKQGDIDISTVNAVSPLVGRFSTGWGYGGGFGGGFHVADVLSLVIPPRYQAGIPDYKWCGPDAILTKIGFPITTNDLQDGQYEGFSYLGTATIMIICILTIVGILRMIIGKGRCKTINSFLKESSFVLRNDIFTYSMMMGVSTFLLFILSWGYIIHLGGVRFNEIPTPSLVLAEIWPKFMFVRTMGRLAIPFMLFVTIAAFLAFGLLLNRMTSRKEKTGEYILAIVAFMVITIHVYEIQGYLEPPKSVIYGNELAREFSEKDMTLIRCITEKKEAIIAVPAIRSDDRWLKICYSLKYVTKIPISGFYSGLAVNQEHVRQNAMDIGNIMSGKLKEVTSKYGNIVIVAPPGIADKVEKISDTPLKRYNLEHKGIAILTL